MADAIQLGGNIELIGFNSLDKIKMFVIKKLVGSHARRISDSAKFERLLLTSCLAEDCYRINAELFGGINKKSESSDKNIFVAVDNALKLL